MDDGAEWCYPSSSLLIVLFMTSIKQTDILKTYNTKPTNIYPHICALMGTALKLLCSLIDFALFGM